MLPAGATVMFLSPWTGPDGEGDGDGDGKIVGSVAVGVGVGPAVDGCVLGVSVGDGTEDVGDEQPAMATATTARDR
jgi:hypothetical protein